MKLLSVNQKNDEEGEQYMVTDMWQMEGPEKNLESFVWICGKVLHFKIFFFYLLAFLNHGFIYKTE